MITITESGMQFGPFPEDACFYIEKSPTYKKLGEGIKIAEFLLLQPQQETVICWVIEAKQSSPKPAKQPNFDEFIAEIQEKMCNSLSLSMALGLKRHTQMENTLPLIFKKLDLATIDFRFSLIINGHDKAWLPPLQDALRKVLSTTVKLWGLSPNAVIVINDEIARKKHFIQM